MNIQWYPGHMIKAKREMAGYMKTIDLIIEILDARIPCSSRNPDLGTAGKEKARIIVLNKADLADPSVTGLWTEEFLRQQISCLPMDARGKESLKKLMAMIDRACAAKKERDRKRGILERPVRAMVTGIPNVGKSTLINMIAGKSSAKTGNKPGVTRGSQWIRINRSVELLDTPGILWPKFERRETGLYLAMTGSISDTVFNHRELSLELIRILKDRYGELLDRKYATAGLTEEETLEKIAVTRGCIMKGNIPDLDKASDVLLNEFKNGGIGRISLERPENFPEKAVADQ
jgi:ribosome biogenesis GTPase A